MDMNSSIWTKDEVIEALVPIQVKGDNFFAAGVSIDSRSIKKGEIFIALSGINSNGHDYIEKATQNGASSVIIDDLNFLNSVSIPVTLVDNCEMALNRLAVYRRKQSKALFIAITGSVGKTSTKEALAFVLKNFGKTYATEGNYNNHLGVPLSLSRMHRDCDYGIFEIGTSNPGEIAPLSVLVKPDIAVITAIAPAHLQNFNSLRDIAVEKSTIIAGLSQNGILFYNGYAAQPIVENSEIKQVNYTEDFIYKHSNRENTSYLSFSYQNQKYEFDRLPMSSILVQLFMAIVSICEYLKLDNGKVSTILNQFQLPKGRGKIHNLLIKNVSNGLIQRKITLIDDSYNANPLSMKESIVFATQMAKNSNQKLVLVIGDMLELGKDEIKFHLDLSSSIDSHYLTWLITKGPLIKNLSDNMRNDINTINFANLDDLYKKLFDIVDNNSVLLIKGSHSTELYKLVDRLLSFETDSAK